MHHGLRRLFWVFGVYVWGSDVFESLSAFIGLRHGAEQLAEVDFDCLDAVCQNVWTPTSH